MRWRWGGVWGTPTRDTCETWWSGLRASHRRRRVRLQQHFLSRCSGHLNFSFGPQAFALRLQVDIPEPESKIRGWGDLVKKYGEQGILIKSPGKHRVFQQVVGSRARSRTA